VLRPGSTAAAQPPVTNTGATSGCAPDIALAVCAGLAALCFAAASGIGLQPGDQSRTIFAGWLAIGLLAVALALM
jgi:hypothetical protein